MNGKRAITIEFDQDALHSYTDSYLAMLWHVAQHNPADGFATTVPGEIAERIGREIIRRWLKKIEPELWHHQGRHHYADELRKIARYEPGSAGWHSGRWVPRTDSEEA